MTDVNDGTTEDNLARGTIKSRPSTADGPPPPAPAQPPKRSLDDSRLNQPTAKRRSQQRLFGNLLVGTLKRIHEDNEKDKQSGVAQRRQALLEAAEQRRKAESEGLVVEKKFKNKNCGTLAKTREEKCQQWIDHQELVDRFLTATDKDGAPPILWCPNPDRDIKKEEVEERIEAQLKKQRESTAAWKEKLLVDEKHVDVVD